MKSSLTRTLILVLSVMIALESTAKKTQPKVNADSIAIAQRTQEIRDSLSVIMDKAKCGDAEAMNEVGTWYYSGKHVSKDFAQAYEWWKKASLMSNVRAIANLGLCYQLGHGVEKDSVGAIRLYEKSIKEGNEVLLKQRLEKSDKNSFDAMLSGDCYERGIGTKKDLEKAAELYAKAAHKGSVDGMRQAGICYLNAKNNSKAFQYFEEGASQGDLTCEFWAGKMLMGDMGIKPNKQQGVVYLLKAAERGMPAAQNEVGVLYSDGNGVTRNLQQAADWYHRAALGGNTKGMWNYGKVLMEGSGVTKDFDMALFWMGEAAPNGFQRAFVRMIGELDSIGDPFADYAIGMKFYLVDDNLKAANDHFKKVEKYKVDEGKIMQSVIMASKRNDKPNAKKAAQNLEKLAGINPEAAFYLATLYETGNGVPQDMGKAISLYSSAANMGYGKAQSYLGDIYYEGRGTDKDLVKAVILYQKALENRQLSQNGYLRFAECFENGQGGLAVDKKKADELRKQKPFEGIIVMLKGLD